MEHKVRKGMKWLWLFWLLCWTACEGEERAGEALLAPKDWEVTVSVRLDAASLRGMGDPGSGTGEGTAEWTRIDIFLVYDWGQVLHYSLGEDYVSGKEQKFYAFAGTVRDVYAVAYKETGVTTVTASSEQGIQDLQTALLSGFSTAEEKKAYLLSLFSGRAGKAIEVEKEKITTIKVTLQRIIAKVDVQWDAQDAYSPEGYVEARMGSITLYGTERGWFFPQFHQAEEALTYAGYYQADDAVSERNGRTYFYTFSGQKNKFTFSVSHKKKGEGASEKTEYTAEFLSPLDVASWHKVNLSVKGTSFEAESHDLQLMSNQGN